MNRAVLVAAPAATFAIAFGRPTLAVPIAGLLVVLVLGGIATDRPAIAAPIAVAFIALVPIYWGRRLGGLGLAAVPVTIAAAVLAPAALRAAGRLRPVAIDAAFAAYAAFRTAAFLVNFNAGSAIGFGARLAAAYVPFRVLGLLPGIRHRLAVSVVASGALLGVLSRFEGGGSNLFFRGPSGYQAATWMRPELRFDNVRVEGSFGHPIPFGLFLAVALTLAVALSFTTEPNRRRRQLALSAIAVLLFVGLLDTLSRGPLLVAAFALAGWMLLERHRVTGWRAIGGTVAAVVLVAFTPALIIVGALWSSTRGDSREARSAEYRVAVAQVVTDPDQFSLLGRPADGLEEGANVVGRQAGFKSLDNEFVVVYVSGGALSLLAFVAIAIGVARVALLARLDAIDRAWAMSTAAAMVGLVSVALLTQYADLFWIATALVAGIAQERRDAPELDRKSGRVASFSETGARR